MAVISIILVSVGIAFLLFSLKPTALICHKAQSHKVGWQSLYVMILFFIAGYALFLYFMGNTIAMDTLSLIIAAIFFGGSIFVCLVAQLSLGSILHLDAIAKEKHFQALHDPLTGLPNRQYFSNVIDSAKIQQAPSYYVMLLDLDKFKLINDLSGHHVGDQLLIAFAKRLHRLANQDIVVSRIGGDEFALLVSKAQGAQIDALAQSIVDLAKRPFGIENQRFNIGVSVGIAKYPEDGSNRSDLLKCADIAMYHAKANSLGFSHFCNKLALEINQINQRITELERAILSSEIYLTYQPILDQQNQHIIGIEAHARWKLDDGSEISPARFIPYARSNKLIHSITSLVLESSLSQLAQWHASGFKVTIHVHLSACDLQDEYVVRRILNLLEHHHIAAHYLTISISEHALLEDAEQAIKYAKQLRDVGVHIAIHEFGTQFASLHYLPILGIDQIKLDHSFTIDLYNQDQDFDITDATIRFAHQMDICVIADHVDNQALKDKLTALQVDAMSGQYFGLSLSTREMTKQLKKYDKIAQQWADTTF